MLQPGPLPSTSLGCPQSAWFNLWNQFQLVCFMSNLDISRSGSILLLVIVAMLMNACAPTTYPGQTPINFSASYEELFEATLDAMINTYWTGLLGQRVGLSVQQVDVTLGFIRADSVLANTGNLFDPTSGRQTVVARVERVTPGITSVVFAVEGGSLAADPGIAIRYATEVVKKLESTFARVP